MPINFTHNPPDTRVDSISGHYVIQKEDRIEYDGRDVLVVYGYAVVEKSCCGSGAGCRFAKVPGFVVEWKSGTDPDGRQISLVEPVEDPEAREKIHEMIDARELYCQVDFE